MRPLHILMPATLLLILGCANIFNSDEKEDGKDGKDTEDPTDTTVVDDGRDADGDGVEASDDCDDEDASVYPGADEACDEVDNDCDGDIDEGASDGASYYADDDGDGYGDGPATEACDPPAGMVTRDGDCNDRNADINPGAAEICNEIDDDCDGTVDDGAQEVDWWEDADRDGYGDEDGRPISSCEQPSGYVDNNDDCDDDARAVNPDGEEVCDGIDNNCDGQVDGDDATDASEMYADADGDGFGDPGTLDLRCSGSPNDLDCDDADDTEPQVADAASTAPRPDGSWASPWAAIQDAIDAANQCVVVVAGTYYENLDFAGQNVLVQSINGARDTIIDGGGLAPVVTFASGERAGAELSGFTLVNGGGRRESTSTTRSCGSSTTCTDYYLSWCGGGIYVDGAAPTLTGLVITANDLDVPADYESGNDTYTHFGFGGGMCVRNAVLAADALEIWSNSAPDGGGIFVESGADFTLSTSTVMGNTATNGAGIEVDGGSLTLENVILSFNEATTSGGGIYAVDATVSVTNVTVGECEAAGSGGGLYLDGSSSGTVMNSIVYGADNGVGILVGSSASLSATYNDVQGNTDGNYSGVTDPTGRNGNISSNPAFTSVTADGNYRNDDWTLTATSPCVDAGNSGRAYDDPDGSTNDMGAYGGPGGGW